jgi:hypothetical protein
MAKRNVIKLTESELHDIISESVINVLNEINESSYGKSKFGTFIDNIRTKFGRSKPHYNQRENPYANETEEERIERKRREQEEWEERQSWREYGEWKGYI